MEFHFAILWSRCDVNYTVKADHYTGMLTKSLHLRFEFLLSGLQEICCFLECHPTSHYRILFLPVLDELYCSVCLQNRDNLVCRTSSKLAYSHCFINTDYQKSQKFGIFVEYEQHSTKLYKFKLRSLVISWSAIRSQSLFSA